MSFLDYFFLLLFFGALVYFYFRNFTKAEHLFYNQFPTPPVEFFFGNAREFTTTTAFFTNVDKYTKQFGSMFHLKMGPFKHVLVSSDYDFIRFVLNDLKSFKKPDALKSLKVWIGEGLTLLEGEAWKARRKLLTPAFHFNLLEKFVDAFESNSKLLVNDLLEALDCDNLDIHPYISRCSLSIINETAMGLQGNTETKTNFLYLQSIREMGRIVVTRFMSLFKRFDFFFRFTKDFRIQQKWVKYLHEQTQTVIKIKRAKLKESTASRNEKKILLDVLLEAVDNGNTLTDEDLRDEVNAFLFAGHDTTASAISFILYCLANHKDIQDEVHREQEQIFSDLKNAKATYANLQEMKYLEAVIKESMRLYSPVTAFPRATTKDINYNGTVIPKGTDILLYFQGLHMNPKYFPNPEKFDPERFQCTDEKQPFAFMPFSTGPRSCIGQKYAMLELKSVISTIVRNFELSPASLDHTMILAAEMILRSLNGIKISLKAR